MKMIPDRNMELKEGKNIEMDSVLENIGLFIVWSNIKNILRDLKPM